MSTRTPLVRRSDGSFVMGLAKVEIDEMLSKLNEIEKHNENPTALDAT